MRILERRDICPRCHKAKGLLIEIKGEKKETPTLCDCDIQRQEKEAECYREAIKKRQEEARRMKSFGDREVKGTFDGDDTHAIQVGRRYVEGFDANMCNKVNGIVFHGSPRQGKTFAAEAIADAVFNAGHTVLMMTAAEIVQKFQYGDKKEVEALDKRIANVDLLVIDDLGASRDTEFGNEVIFTVIDKRYTTGKPLIVTTNKSKADMADTEYVAEQRIYGRILEKCYPCKVERDGSDLFTVYNSV